VLYVLYGLILFSKGAPVKRGNGHARGGDLVNAVYALQNIKLFIQ
jgi:hypothetical protein